jgi:adenine-specific DNA-methyltransferase
MNQNILKFLKKYSYNPLDINRIIVSSFLITNNIINPKNEFIRKYIITNDENELQQLNEFILLFKDLDFNIEKLIKLFEFVISPADKEVNGAVYTPRYIRDYIVNETLRKFDNNKNIDEIIFGDIACGCGGFFVTIAETIKNKTKKKYFDIYSENIYGLDIQGYSIERTKILLSLLAISEGEDYPNIQFNLFEGNALGFDWKTVPAINENLGFDIILGNPPYVGATKIDKESKSLLKNWSVSKSGKSDLYIPFFEIGMVNLNSAGILGYITVNTFYKSLNGRSVRSYFSKNKFDLSIVDFGGEQLFKSRSTYTCICIIGKEQSSKIKYIKTTSDSVNRLKNKDFISIPYSSLNDFEGWYLNEKQTNNLILKIEATGKPLGTIFEIRNGFATLKNNIYVFRPIKESEDFFYLNKDGIEYKIEKDICRNTIKPNTLKSESEIENNTETLIFPYLYEETHDLFGKNSRLLKILDETFFKKNFLLHINIWKLKKRFFQIEIKENDSTKNGMHLAEIRP